MTDSLIAPPASTEVRGNPTSPASRAPVDPRLDLVAEIGRLRRERKAIILAHYYQDAEIQDVADFVGDSLDLSRKAASTDADVIVFCGVKFMAEVAKILSPSKTVLLPDMAAGCSLEDSCKPGPFKAFRDAHPGYVAVTYINCSAEVKALSDIIVTSSNAEAIIRQIPADKPILFAPDRNLGAYLAKVTGREMTLWPGTCIVHESFAERELARLKARHPKALVASHPESAPAVLAGSDHVGSTRSILEYVLKSPAEEFIIGTDAGIIHQMRKQAPHKRFIAISGTEGPCACNACPFMALNTVEKLYLALRDMTPRLELAEPLRQAALLPLERMLAMSSAIPAPAETPTR
ncbi:MAG TPA: quinolinate synthase NadA [Alphaproteobacteria bacterium]|jgi:quinolinate synthase